MARPHLGWEIGTTWGVGQHDKVKRSEEKHGLSQYDSAAGKWHNAIQDLQGWSVMWVPVSQKCVHQGVAFVCVWSSCVHILCGVCKEGGSNGGGHGLVDENEVNHRHGSCEKIILEHPKRSILYSKTNDCRQHSAEGWRQKPFSCQHRSQLAQIRDWLGSQREIYEDQQKDLCADVHNDIVYIPSHCCKVKSKGLHHRGIAAECSQVSGAE